ncbi:asparaginase [Paraburkholderia sp. ZP32-5]|uniref:asparaginase n=1 Tax=Paraburkholderia sp. ZP32-5 TaxID=2883245 RepID=UPI001F36FD7A|nr:asparaginase [Paraburkholderia sp. ZP32-5]
MSIQRKPRVAVIGTGGTFAMHARDPFDWVEYADSGIVHPIGHLLETLGELAPGVEIVPIDFRSLGSVAIQPTDWLELARLIDRSAKADPSITGFVVTHGTATMEETAWFLQIVLDIEQPVIITGAQRPANTAGSDVPANLRAAISAASTPGSRNAGVLVAMDGWLFDARDVTKAASFELNAFEAPPFGPLARVEPDGSVTWRRKAAQINSFAHKLLDDESITLPRVDIVLSYAGADGTVIDALVQAGSRCIISAGLVPGRPASGEIAAYRRAVEQGVVVVQSSRAARGCVPVQRFLKADGILSGNDLAPQKLRIAMMVALAVYESTTAEQLQAQLQALLSAL